MGRKAISLDELGGAYAKEMERAMGPAQSRTPLATALIAASFIEKALMGLLSEHMIKCSTAENMFKSGQPLGDMMKCANMAYALGLICKAAHGAILAIGDVRNAFAHAHEELDFSSPVIKTEMAKLKPPLGGTLPAADLATRPPQEMFEWVAKKLFLDIMISSLFLSQQRPLCGFREWCAEYVLAHEKVWTDASVTAVDMQKCSELTMRMARYQSPEPPVDPA